MLTIQKKKQQQQAGKTKKRRMLKAISGIWYALQSHSDKEWHILGHVEGAAKVFR